jgi:tRNA-2-methylthio-N6-dimethylallyladenosine synthase
MLTPHPYLHRSQERRLLYVKTFGCQMNEYDSLRLQRILGARGYALTADITCADVIFLNTCSVREKPEQKVYSFLGRLKKLKTRHPALKIIVGGCVAQQLGERLLDRFGYLDIVLGTRGVHAVGEILEKVQQDNGRLAYLPETEPVPRKDLEVSLPDSSSVIVAPVTIMQGCNNFCSYCIVPYVRGRESSRPATEIIREIQALTGEGMQEVVLLGQNVNSYVTGPGGRKSGFVELLQRIHSETDVQRIRFTTSHPKDLTVELMQCFAELPRLCRHLHLPFQAGADRILALMNRGYTSAQYLRKIARLREYSPDIGLSADVMVGFPGETEDDFQDTLRLIEQAQFDNLFSFRYSDRPYAQSSEFPTKVDDAVKSHRLTVLQSHQATVTLIKNQREAGLVREVLVEGPSKACNGQLTGRTHQNRVVNFDGPKELIGKTICVKIREGFSHSLKGERVSP